MSIVIPNIEIDGHAEGRGLSSRKTVRAATVIAGTLATSFANGQTIDGIVIVTNDRILIKNQTSSIENGVYIVQTSGAPVRAIDFDEGDDVLGALVLVEEGSKNQNTGWLCIGATSKIVGTDVLNFKLITGDVSGQLSSTDNAIVRWHGTDGYSVQDTNVQVDDSDNITGLQYLEFNDVTAPSNPSDGQGRLYKKTGDDGIFWKPDSAGLEVDLTAAGGGGEANTASNVGVGGVGPFKQKTGVNLEFKNINGGSARISVTDDVANNEIDIDTNGLIMSNVLSTFDTVNGSTTSTTYVDMPSMSLTTTLTGEIIILATTVLDIPTGANRVIETIINYNGVDIAATHKVTMVGSSGESKSVTVMWHQTGVVPGQIVKMRWKVSAGTAQVQNRILIVQEFI